jgi:hypothetical protein
MANANCQPAIAICELLIAAFGRLSAECCWLTASLNRFRDWVPHYRIHQADPESFRRVQFFGGKEHLQGAAFADQTGKTLGAAPSRDESEGGATVAKDCMRGCNAMATGESEIEASTHAIAFDRGVGRRGMGRDGVHQALAEPGEFERGGAVESGDLGEVSAGGEKMYVAREDQRIRGTAQLKHNLCESGYTFAREAVGLVERSEPDDGGARERLELDLGRQSSGRSRWKHIGLAISTLQSILELKIQIQPTQLSLASTHPRG